MINQLYPMALKAVLLPLCIWSVQPVFAQSWVVLPSATGNTSQDLWFNALHPDTGMVCGYYVAAGDVLPFGLRTVDGGSTMAPMDLFFGGSFTGAFGLAFTDVNTGFMCGGGMLKTYDGGQTWIQSMDVFTVGGLLYDVSFPTAVDGSSVGESWDVNGIYMGTHDAGSTWEPHIVSTSANNENTHLTCVASTVPERIYAGAAVSFSGSPTLFISNDDGVTWTPLAFTVGVNDLVAVQGDTVFAATDLGIYRITAEGGSIQPVLSLFVPGVNSLDLRGTEGLAVAGNGSIYRSVDSGATWSAMTSPVTGTFLISVRFATDRIAYACGGGGTLLRYSGPSVGVDERYPGSGSGVSPNPADHMITIDRPSNAAPAMVGLFDAQGRCVKDVVLVGARTSVDVHDLPVGAYYVRSNDPMVPASRSFFIVR